MIAFGPVPSRRLGQSLGINNIPPKVCTYSCIYCQIGRTTSMEVPRRAFYEPEEILKDVQGRVLTAREGGISVDHLTFVSDGEPTLDINLGREIDLLRPLDIPIAVITNASHIWRDDVQEELGKADWISLKVDTTREEVWHQVNRPHGALQLTSILDGGREFARIFDGELATETMLIEGINDKVHLVQEVAEYLAGLPPTTAYLTIPTRPPAEEWVRSPSEEAINRAYQFFANKMDRVEYLIGYEGNAFAFTGHVEEDLLGITAVHPMRAEAISDFLARAGTDWTAVHNLVAKGELREVEYEGRKFYMRRIR